MSISHFAIGKEAEERYLSQLLCFRQKENAKIKEDLERSNVSQ